MTLTRNIDEALRIAAKDGDLIKLNTLIDEKSLFFDYPKNLNFKDNFGDTLLHTAIFASKFEVVSRLIEVGVDIDLRNNNGNTPVNAALIAHLKSSQERHSLTLPIIKLLIDSGANVNTRNNRNETPLHFAAKMKNTQALIWLIEANAFLNAKNKDQGTPLHHAALEGHVENIRILMNAGAELNHITKHYSVESSSGRYDPPLTPLGLAAHFGYFDVVQALAQGGAKFEEADVLIAEPGIRPQVQALFENLKLKSVLIEDRPEDDSTLYSSIGL